MNHVPFLRILASTALLTLAPVQAGESPYKQVEVVGYVFCTAARSQREMPDESIRPAVIYYSGAFEIKGQNLKPMNDAYLAFLDKKYGYRPDPNELQPVSCVGVHSLAEAQSVEKMRAAKSRQGAGDVIETGWTYSSATPSGESPLNPGPAASSQHAQAAEGGYWICEIDDGAVHYLSDLSGPNQWTGNFYTTLAYAFRDFVYSRNKLTPNRPPQCFGYHTEDEARDTLKYIVATPPSGGKVVQTGWKYGEPPPET